MEALDLSNYEAMLAEAAGDLLTDSSFLQMFPFVLRSKKNWRTTSV
jgi:hypothetical protein